MSCTVSATSKNHVHVWLAPQIDDLSAVCGVCGKVVDMRSERFTPVLAASWINAIEYRQGRTTADTFRAAYRAIQAALADSNLSMAERRASADRERFTQ